MGEVIPAFVSVNQLKAAALRIAGRIRVPLHRLFRPCRAPLPGRWFTTEGIHAGDVAPDRQDVDVFGAFAGVRGLEV